MGYEETMKANMEAGRNKKFPHKILFFLAIVGTNLVTYLLVSGQQLKQDAQQSATLLSRPVSQLSFQLNYTQAELLRTQQALHSVEKELKGSFDQSEGLFREIAQAMELIRSSTQAMAERRSQQELQEEEEGDSKEAWSQWSRLAKGDLIRELQEFIAVRKLPLGWSPGLASDTLVSPVGHACAVNVVDLQHYMEYEPGSECPDDQDLAQRLLLHGCEPLPRRRCLARVPTNFTDPYPYPKCLWTIPPNNNIHWTAYPCKSFECLNDRKNHRVSADCLDCFELHGREKGRWVGGGGPIDFTINEVLGMKNGSIRIGLDIGGGTASFAVRMKEYDVTIVTTTMNFDGPFNNMIALRGVVPIYMSVSQRFPFFDNTLDIVHSMHVLSNWIPTETLQFILFDIDRILRPGGLLWLDHFFCIRHELNDLYVPMIEKLGYKKLKWAVGDKLDRGPDKQEVYLSAVLEKPYIRRSSKVL